MIVKELSRGVYRISQVWPAEGKAAKRKGPTVCSMLVQTIKDQPVIIRGSLLISKEEVRRALARA